MTGANAAGYPRVQPVWSPKRSSETAPGADPEFISVPEWARRVGICADSAYKAARLGQIPGCFAIGRLYRVNWAVFVRRAGDELVQSDQSSPSGRRVS